MEAKILIVDDDPDILSGLRNRLRWLGHDVSTAEDGAQALELLRHDKPDLVLLDIELPKLSGLEVLKQLADPREVNQAQVSRGSTPAPVVIIMTAFGTVDRAVEAMRLGAFDFLTKPFDADRLAVVLEKALAHRALQQRVADLSSEIDRRYGQIVGASPRMEMVVETAKKAAAAEITVLLLGETGTGKEVLARHIHRWSARASKPFMVINCAALPETLLENELFGHEKGSFTGANQREAGKIEAAEGGTVFLDEIGDLPLILQARLLRVLQDQEFHRVGGTKTIRANVRFLAATNRDLAQAVQRGTFREDLYFRINVLSIVLPPLRERMEDLPLLTDWFLKVNARTPSRRQVRVSVEAMSGMMQYHWPGNVRELENVLARAMVLCAKEEIEPEHLGLLWAPAVQEHTHAEASLSYHEAMGMHSRRVLIEALRRAGGNQTRAAEALGLQRTYLTKLLRQKGIAGKSTQHDSEG